MQKGKHHTSGRFDENTGSTFEDIYNSYYVYLCSIATKYIYNPEAAKEIVNDVFLSIWDKSPEITSSIISYLRKSVRNKCLNYLRDQHIQSVSLSESELLSIREQQLLADEQPLLHLENKELAEIIKSEINKLPGRCREIFDLYLYHEKSYDEIAEMLSISPSTVRVQMKIGIAKLKSRLGGIHPFLWMVFYLLLKKHNIS